jgi:hypothetical protein
MSSPNIQHRAERREGSVNKFQILDLKLQIER